MTQWGLDVSPYKPLRKLFPYVGASGLTILFFCEWEMPRDHSLVVVFSLHAGIVCELLVTTFYSFPFLLFGWHTLPLTQSWNTNPLCHLHKLVKDPVTVSPMPGNTLSWMSVRLPPCRCKRWRWVMNAHLCDMLCFGWGQVKTQFKKSLSVYA